MIATKRAPLKALWVAGAAVLAGCGTLRSGTAMMTEIHIPGAHRLLVADALTRAMLNRGYQIRNLDEKQAVFAKPADGVPGAMLLGSGRASAPESRVRYALTETDGGVRIVARIEVVTNPGSRMEHISPPNGGNDAELVQQALNTVRERLTRKASPAQAPAAAAAPAPAPKAEGKKAAKPAAEKPPAKAAPPSSKAPESEKASWDRPDEDMLEEMRRRAMGKP